MWNIGSSYKLFDYEGANGNYLDSNEKKTLKEKFLIKTENEIKLLLEFLHIINEIHAKWWLLSETLNCEYSLSLIGEVPLLVWSCESWPPTVVGPLNSWVNRLLVASSRFINRIPWRRTKLSADLCDTKTKALEFDSREEPRLSPAHCLCTHVRNTSFPEN